MFIGNAINLYQNKPSLAPSWALTAAGTAATIDIDFINNRAFNSLGSPTTPTIASLFNCTRASTGYYTKADGTLTSFTNNVLRYGTNGVLVEEARTNIALWCRDMTNAAWVKVTCTAALNQTGNDGTVNGASSLTATAGNATCLQTIVDASQARFVSCWIKRLSGAGVINMTMDAGVTWTVVTVTSSWTLVVIPTQTLANPVIGFRIVTNGDSIAVDFAQSENGTYGTSPIVTTTTSASRSSDSIVFVSAAFLSTPSMSVYAQGWGSAPVAANLAAIFSNDIIAGGGENFMRYSLDRFAAFGRNGSFVTQWSMDVGITSYNTIPDALRHKAIFSGTTNDINGCAEDGLIVSAASGTIPPSDRAALGSQVSTNFWNGYIERLAYWKNTRISNSSMQSLSTANTIFLILADGDSIPLSPASTNNFMSQIHTNAPSLSWSVRNMCVSGSSIGGVGPADLAGTARVAAFDAALNTYKAQNAGLKHGTVIHIGHNDFAIDGDSTGTFLTQLSTYCDARRTAGHKIILMPVPPSTFAGLNTWRATVNATIATWAGLHADFVIDVSAVTGYLDADASNVSLWSDGTHPTQAMAANIAAAIRTQALNSLSA